MHKRRVARCAPYTYCISRRNFFSGKQLRVWLLLDSRVVDVPMAYNPIFVLLSSLKPFFFNSLKNELCFSDNMGA